MRLPRIIGTALLAAWAGLALAQAAPPAPGPRDLCPVCGMLVSKYPTWAATLVYRDGHAHHFDGAKDMFKFWFEPGKYAAGHTRAAMTALWVTDFYGLQRIDARKAFYVIGSDVLGPMGHELVPLATREDAEAFLKEHKGKRVLRFDDVTLQTATRLDG